ncbi:hypothetical protein PC116_g18371 [Phytophthora cactorum]|nr:hypothetical protein Pcac1_g11490 [Phytophthora cactorum]KAG2925961.1 hypothetical protein PC117_g15039 [Phytophthora cactorum]KAG3176946.1 hypothetical protein C6341_g8712 [Phytophthora cactorum]KAG4233433.1 hypothetical protein PC116_g18371 [Phytophthora cactorum]
MQIGQAVERFDSGEDVNGRSVYWINQLQAMQWSKQLWTMTPASTVAHCGQKTGLVAPIRGVEEPNSTEDWCKEAGDEDVVYLMLKVASILQSGIASNALSQ